MTQDMPMTRATTTDDNVRLEDLCFSRTDARGVIAAGNEVFHRVSEYDWDELINAPHNILRHRDMPKAVFWLFWDALKKGRPFGAYVKNATKSGDHYWEFAIATPIENGFLSVQLKPTSKLFAAVKTTYADLLQFEKSEDSTPTDCGARLLGILSDLGFETYEAFMTAALSAEMAKRDDELGRRSDDNAKHLLDIEKSWNRVIEHCKESAAARQMIMSTPANMKVHASRLADIRGSLSEISTYFGTITDDMDNKLAIFANASKAISQTLQLSQFRLHVARLQKEVGQNFQNGSGTDTPVNAANEMAILDRQRSLYLQQVTDTLDELRIQIHDFNRSCNALERSVSALGVSHVMCGIEISGIRQKNSGIETTVAELADTHKFLKSKIGGIKHELHKVSGHIALCSVERPANCDWRQWVNSA